MSTSLCNYCTWLGLQDKYGKDNLELRSWEGWTGIYYVGEAVFGGIDSTIINGEEPIAAFAWIGDQCVCHE